MAFRGDAPDAVEAAWIPEPSAEISIRKLRHLAAIQNSNVDKKSYDEQEQVRLCNYTDVYYNEAIHGDLELMASTASSQEIARFGLQEGDVIITKDSEDWRDIGVPVCVAEDLEGVVCGYHLTMIRPNSNVEGRFLFRALQSTGVRDQLFVGATGITRYSLGQDTIKDLLVPVPNLGRQRAIADFLDRKTAAIDVLIEKKQKLLDLLAEKRAALIHQAVTKGLDPTAPMKPSGIDWIGEIPEHWEVMQTRRVVSSASYGTSEPLNTEGSLPVLRMNNISGGALDLSDLKYLDGVDDLLLLKPGDIVYNRTNSWALVGKAALVADNDLPLSFASYLVRLRTESFIGCEYFCYLINSPGFLAEARSRAIPSISQANLSASVYLDLPAVVPTLEEQKRIAAHCKNADRESAELTECLNRQVGGLHEYRQALITAAVTGQLEIS